MNTASVIASIESALDAIRPSGATPVETGALPVSKTTARNSPGTAKASSKGSTTKKPAGNTKKSGPKTTKKASLPKKGKHARDLLKRDGSGTKSVGKDGITTLYGQQSVTCTDYEHEVYAYNDVNQVPYVVKCGGDALGDTPFTMNNVQDFNACFQLCDTYDTGCTGFSWQEANLGDSGMGSCLIKTATSQSLTNYGGGGAFTTGVAGVMRAFYTAQVTPSTTTTVPTTTATTVASVPTESGGSAAGAGAAGSAGSGSGTTVGGSGSGSTGGSGSGSGAGGAASGGNTVATTNNPATGGVTQGAGNTATTAAAQPPASTGPCSQVTAVLSPQPSLVSANDFITSPQLRSNALSATTPSGYTPVFQGYYESLSMNGYLGYTELGGYDTDACAFQCDRVSACVGFNIWYERNAGQEPYPQYSQADCPNPPAITRVKCSIWSQQPSGLSATNYGGWRVGFALAIAGSNAYVKTSSYKAASAGPATSVTNFNYPSALGGAVSVPAAQKSKIIGARFFSEQWNPQLCATACYNLTQTNLAHAVSSKAKTYTGEYRIVALHHALLTILRSLQLFQHVCIEQEQCICWHVLQHVHVTQCGDGRQASHIRLGRRDRVHDFKLIWLLGQCTGERQTWWW